MGRFLWSGVSTRIPMQQLARDREEGGLKLQLPAIKCKSLLLNRHLQEIDALPFYKSFLFPENPTQVTIPADLPDLKILCQQYQQLPLHIKQTPSADLIHRHFVRSTEQPKVELKYPNANWKRAWLSIHSRRYSPVERSNLYLIVNEKGSYRKLLFKVGRADGDNCLHCNTVTETMEHKYADCPRVQPAWRYLQQRMNTIFRGWRRLSFVELIQPSLDHIRKDNRIKILKLFINYILFVDSVNDYIDVNSLKLHLDCEVEMI